MDPFGLYKDMLYYSSEAHEWIKNNTTPKPIEIKLLDEISELKILKLNRITNGHTKKCRKKFNKDIEIINKKITDIKIRLIDLLIK